MVEKIFFQSSMPRSGSTTLQNLISERPDFYATSTSGLLELCFSARAAFSTSLEFKAQDQELMNKAFIGFCRNGIQGYANELTDKKYFIDKKQML